VSTNNVVHSVTKPFKLYSASWEKQRARSKVLTEAEIRERIPDGHPLQCPICHKLFQDAVKTPCCSTTYCQECLHNHLSDNDFVCPNCHQKIATLASVKPDMEARHKVDDYIDTAFEEHRQHEIKNANVVLKVHYNPNHGKFMTTNSTLGNPRRTGPNTEQPAFRWHSS
jgi:hypothetical protein